ncbi:hypothetical protein [Chitinimonas sp. BJYL2]|uniref:hypothetical protein n=1 Tax=Chitinimonas sp. BJYL2 TaxID=2976696 RepID=UPI0022B4D35A|nr:hypothetical protein [Chitinimonas sp. BJYL2]
MVQHKCSEGYELEGLSSSGQYKSRWFEVEPSPDDLLGFVRDLGESHPVQRRPRHPEATAARMPQGGWQISTALVRPISPYALGAGGFVIICGCLAVIESAQLVRLHNEHKKLTLEAVALEAQNAQVRAIEAEMASLTPTLDTMQQYIGAPRQTNWLAAVVRHDIAGSLPDVYIAEWDYNGSRLTVTLKPGPRARNTDIISRIERSRLFSDVSLIPDPPPGTLRLMLKLSTDTSANLPQAQS